MSEHKRIPGGWTTSRRITPGSTHRAAPSHGYDLARGRTMARRALEIMKDLVARSGDHRSWPCPTWMVWNFAATSELRARFPILVLSVRGEERTKVKALDAGADDYITNLSGSKSCWPECAPTFVAHARKNPEEAPIRSGANFRIDPGARTVHVPKRRPVHLTPKEFDLLVYMAHPPRKSCNSSRRSSARLWGGGEQPSRSNICE